MRPTPLLTLFLNCSVKNDFVRGGEDLKVMALLSPSKKAPIEICTLIHPGETERGENKLRHYPAICCCNYVKTNDSTRIPNNVRKIDTNSFFELLALSFSNMNPTYRYVNVCNC